MGLSFSTCGISRLSTAELGDSVLANSLAVYRQRRNETGEPLNSFTATI